jgi:hypothetical protein
MAQWHSAKSTTCVNDFKTRQSEPDAWQEEWCAMASRLEKVADKAASSAMR